MVFLHTWKAVPRKAGQVYKRDKFPAVSSSSSLYQKPVLSSSETIISLLFPQMQMRQHVFFRLLQEYHRVQRPSFPSRQRGEEQHYSLSQQRSFSPVLLVAWGLLPCAPWTLIYRSYQVPSTHRKTDNPLPLVTPPEGKETACKEVIQRKKSESP